MSPPGAAARETRFRELFSDSYADVVRFATRRVDPSVAEDVAAEAFLVVWRRLDELPARAGDARAWLFGVTRGCLLNARRGQGRQDALAVRLSTEDPQRMVDLDGTDDAVRRVDLRRAWRELSPAQQEVLALALLDDVTSAEAASILGTTSTAYRLRLARARAALRRLLETPTPAPTSPRSAAPSAARSPLEVTP
jgi:RNA polymerase sigma-70 factor (ECF subfamily)